MTDTAELFIDSRFTQSVCSRVRQADGEEATAWGGSDGGCAALRCYSCKAPQGACSRVAERERKSSCHALGQPMHSDHFGERPWLRRRAVYQLITQ